MTKQKILTTRKLELTIRWGNAISKQNFLVKKSSNKIKFSERVLAVRHFAFCYKTKSDAIDRWKLIVLNEKKNCAWQGITISWRNTEPIAIQIKKESPGKICSLERKYNWFAIVLHRWTLCDTSRMPTRDFVANQTISKRWLEYWLQYFLVSN